MLYETQEQAQLRLNGTVFIYDGKAVHCSGSFQPAGRGVPLMLTVSNLPENEGDPIQGDSFNIEITDPRLKYMELPTGYINMPVRNGGPGNAVFIARSPVRQNRQGLYSGNIRIHPFADGRMTSWDVIRRSPGLSQMFRGEYPTYKEAQEKLANGSHERVAVSRLFAISSKGKGWPTELFYRETSVAWFQPDGRIEIPKEFSWMREMIQELKIA